MLLKCIVHRQQTSQTALGFTGPITSCLASHYVAATVLDSPQFQVIISDTLRIHSPAYSILQMQTSCVSLHVMSCSPAEHILGVQ